MAVALTFNPTFSYSYQTVTGSLTGLAPSTQYTAVISDPDGSTFTMTFTSDGTGNGSFQVTPDTNGAYTVTVAPSAPVTSVTGSFNAGGM